MRISEAAAESLDRALWYAQFKQNRADCCSLRHYHAQLFGPALADIGNQDPLYDTAPVVLRGSKWPVGQAAAENRNRIGRTDRVRNDPYAGCPAQQRHPLEPAGKGDDQHENSRSRQAASQDRAAARPCAPLHLILFPSRTLRVPI